MTVICINDVGRPNEVPANKWIKEGESYTVVDTIKCNCQGGAIAYVLEEIDLTECDPYKGFNASRFAVQSDIVELYKEVELKEAA